MADTNTEITIQHLNAVLKSKLTGINQYFLHARMLKHRGEVRLADYEYKASLGAMKHADMLVEHILSIGGAPLLEELGALGIGREPVEMLRCDMTLAQTVLGELQAALAHCEQAGDTATAGLLGRIMESQLERITQLNTQLQSPLAA